MKRGRRKNAAKPKKFTLDTYIQGDTIMATIRIPEPIAFEWDDGNEAKIWLKHSVRAGEAEECFFDKRKRLAHDSLHTTEFEARYILLGKTRRSRLLFIVFTLRNENVRVISARDSTPKERRLYAART